MHESASLKLRHAAAIIKGGGVIAYPTEAVFGLGCNPECQVAVDRILRLKQRKREAGLIVIAANEAQLSAWIAPTAAERERFSATDDVITWIMTASRLTPDWITGGRPTIAVRITQHPVAAALCLVAGMPLVSTSANRHGHPPARSALSVRCKFGQEIDYVVPGVTWARSSPSEIREARTGRILRPA